MLPRTLCPVLVGRDQEMSDLEDAMLAARRGEGGIVLVAGDAGIGKSRLLREFRSLAEQAGLPVLTGACSEADVQVPYLPFLEAIRAPLRQAGPDSDPELEGLFGRPAQGPVDPQERRVRLFEAVGRFLESLAAGGGAVLAVEDLHWSDSGTRDLLDYLSRVLPESRLLILGSYRADEVDRRHPLHPLVRGWVQRGVAQVVELRPLGPTGVATMLAATVGSADAALARRLFERSEGNPFVLEEILKTEGTEPAPAGVPATVREAILRRVDALPAKQVEVLRAAAVLGEPVDDELLADLLGEAVPGALEECARQQLLTENQQGGYRWRHAITREAVYQELAPSRRRRLHSQLADLCTGRAGYDEVALCRHLAEAERWSEAVPSSRRAAASATAVGAFDDAARLLQVGLDHVSDPHERSEVLAELTLLLVQAGRPEDGERYAREAVDLREDAGEHAAAAEARRTLAVCLWQQGRWDEAIALEDQAIAELELIGPSPLLAEALARRGAWGVIARDEVELGLGRVARARQLASALGYESAVLRGHEGQVLAMAGRLDEGMGIVDDCWRTLLGEPRGSAAWREGKFLQHHAAALRQLFGRIADSLRVLAERPARGQDAADASLDTVEADVRWAHGDVELAARLVARLDLADIERNVIPWAQVSRATLLASAGDLEAAAELARHAMPPHWQASSQLRTSEVVRILGLAGDLDTACRFESRLPGMAGYPAFLRLPLLDALVEAHLAAGRPAEAAAAAAGAADAPPDHPLRLRLQARLALARKDAGGALANLDQAARGFAALGWRQEEWRSRRLHAEALARSGDREGAEAELREVLRECESGGEALQARQAATALAALGVHVERPKAEPVLPPSGVAVAVRLLEPGSEARAFQAWALREVERRGGRTDGWSGEGLAAVFPAGAAAAAAALRDKAAYRGVAVEVTSEAAERPRLSGREREVAGLVAQGLRNREIAARLFLSERTVENHIHRVLERTGLRSRTELAAWVARLSGELSVSPE